MPAHVFYLFGYFQRFHLCSYGFAMCRKVMEGFMKKRIGLRILIFFGGILVGGGILLALAGLVPFKYPILTTCVS